MKSSLAKPLMPSHQVHSPVSKVLSFLRPKGCPLLESLLAHPVSLQGPISLQLMVPA